MAKKEKTQKRYEIQRFCMYENKMQHAYVNADYVEIEDGVLKFGMYIANDEDQWVAMFKEWIAWRQV
jgi:hypothetical protein